MLSISCMTNWKNIWNNVGDNKHPRLKPRSTANYSVSFLSLVTQQLVFLYKLLIILMVFSLTIMCITIFHKAFLHTISKAALKSTKSKWTATLCSLAFPKICHTINIAWIVPLFCRNPNWLAQVNRSLCISLLCSSTLLDTFPGIDSKDMAR